MSYQFEDRFEAGVRLAERLRQYESRDDVIVLALPRGGVPVGFEVARALGAPLDVFLVRKLGVPGHEELAMGAIASGGVRLLNEEVVQSLRIPEAVIEEAVSRQQQELARRERAYRKDAPPLDLENRVVILVDDGLATGASMRAAVRAARLRHPLRVVVAVPVGARETAQKIKREVDEIVCVQIPEFFFAVGQWYQDFSQTTDEEVEMLLERAGSLQHAAHA